MDATIFVVDDDPTTRLLLNSILAKKYQVSTFETGEACLEEMAQRMPQILLLDVGLPGKDGFEVCRDVKALPGGPEVVVVFVSGHDSTEEILSGFDAGGEDYVVKPFEVASLYRKIENLQRIHEERRIYREQAKSSDELASLVLANLDEYAALIKFLRLLNECASDREIAEAVLKLLSAFRLEGAVQVRLRDYENTYSKTGENWPLEIAVIKHVRNLERVFEFKQRAAYNFDTITVLVTNMPIHDAELCGRIRDHLAIAAESADAKLKALQTQQDKVTIRDEIHKLLAAIEAAVKSYSLQYDQARYKGSLFTSQMQDQLLGAFAHLGMSSAQEEEILGMVKEQAYRLIDLYDIGGETHATLNHLSQRMEQMLRLTESEDHSA